MLSLLKKVIAPFVGDASYGNRQRHGGENENQDSTPQGLNKTLCRGSRLGVAQRTALSKDGMGKNQYQASEQRYRQPRPSAKSSSGVFDHFGPAL